MSGGGWCAPPGSGHVFSLGAPLTGDILRDALRALTSDPDLEVFYRVQNRGTYVTSSGELAAANLPAAAEPPRQLIGAGTQDQRAPGAGARRDHANHPGGKQGDSGGRPAMRVVIAEDGILRRPIERMLADGGHDVRYAARTGDELLAFLSRAAPPDVAVLDIRMPPTNTDEGVTAAERIREKWPAVGILLFSTYTLVPMAERLLALTGSGGLGYLSKDTVEDGDELSRAVQGVGNRQRVLDPQLVRDLMARRRETPLDDLLTERELAVLRLIAEGRANKAIAETLVVSVKTVEDHSRSLFAKLGVAPAPGYNQRVLAVLEWLRRTG